MKVKKSVSQKNYLNFNKWPFIQYKLWESLVLWNHNNGELCWLGNGPEERSLTPSTKRVIHRGSLLKAVAVQGVLYQSIFNAKLTGKKKLGRKMYTSHRDDLKLENTAKLIQTLGRASQGVNWSWSQCSRVTTLRHLQEKGYQATSETETSSEASYLS